VPRRKSPPSPEISGEVRVQFIAKQYGKKWRVYDRELASYPVMRPEFEENLPEFDTEEECQSIVDKLEEKRSGSR